MQLNGPGRALCIFFMPRITFGRMREHPRLAVRIGSDLTPIRHSDACTKCWIPTALLPRTGAKLQWVLHWTAANCANACTEFYLGSPVWGALFFLRNKLLLSLWRYGRWVNLNDALIAISSVISPNHLLKFSKIMGYTY